MPVLLCHVLPAPFREVTHVLTLWFQGGSPLSCSSLDELLVDKFKLAPACVEITDLVVDNEGTEGGMARMVMVSHPLITCSDCKCLWMICHKVYDSNMLDSNSKQQGVTKHTDSWAGLVASTCFFHAGAEPSCVCLCCCWLCRCVRCVAAC